MDLWVFCLEPNIIQEKRTAIREIENSCLEFIFKLEGILCHIIAKEENRRTIFAFCILLHGMHPSYLQEQFKKKSSSIMRSKSCQLETGSNGNLGLRVQRVSKRMLKLIGRLFQLKHKSNFKYKYRINRGREKVKRCPGPLQVFIRP